jgi:nicotinate phosphoribosyltransferase
VSTALLTDRYELTMVQAALQSGRANRQCVFEVFARQLPAGRRFGVVAGVERALELIEEFRFTEVELEWLEREQVVDAATLSWLADYKFCGDISGYRDGELYFGSSPVLTVTASFAEAVLLETLILSVLNFDSAIASAASRMVLAAEGRRLIEMGSRRTHESAAVAAARAAYLVGFDATSNLEAGRRYGIPTMGTSAHSFTLLHDSEREAFAAQLKSMGPDTTLLVDTFDVEAAVRAAVEMIPGGPGAVRLDSGDLVEQAQKVRTLLDSLGATRTRIVVTSDLDEFAIASLAAAPVDGYGVGTSLVSGSGHPTAGFVYKLVAHTDDNENWVQVAKKSALKTNRGGRKFAYRELANGFATRELLSGEAAALGRELQSDFLVAGSRVARFDLDSARAHHAQVLGELSGSARRLSRGEPAIAVEFAS